MMERDAICGGELSQKVYLIPESEYRLDDGPINGLNIKTIMPLY